MGGDGDRRLAQAALGKRARGEKASREEAAALRRGEKERDERLRAEHYGAIPKRLWVEWSGRQHKILTDLQVQYGIPLGGRTVNLPEVVRWIHELLKRCGPRLLESAPPPSPLDAIREEELKTKRIKNELLAGNLVPLSDIRAGMKGFAAHIRKAGEILRRRDTLSGDEAAEILNNAMTDARREWTDSLPADDDAPAL